MDEVPSITEVLPEPGGHDLWVSFADGQTHRVDLTPLLQLERYRPLRLPTLFPRVRVTPDARHLTWPGGTRLDAESIFQAPSGSLPVILVAVVPFAERYRPLLPYLQHQQPRLYLRSAPIEAVTVQRLLQLRAGELEQALRGAGVPEDVLLNRLYDVAVFLNEHFSSSHLAALLRRPWHYGEQRCPDCPLLHTMLGCLQHGRPDLVERPCMLMATGT